MGRARPGSLNQVWLVSGWAVGGVVRDLTDGTWHRDPSSSALIAAIASDVEFLLLDEPTSGLGPLMEAVFREVITEERRASRTVLLSSHIRAEVEMLCVSIIRDGRYSSARPPWPGRPRWPPPSSSC